ncbi:MAG: hypothetical protein D3926_01345 [Desulfobacteraceae bacterium]|nr:MAG: hypothetical protein D3926_01345 [Desulfobacteraceae bacterium]
MEYNVRCVQKMVFICFLLFFSIVQAQDPPGPIIIGATVSETGGYHEPSLMIKKAFHLWVDEINDGGGLLGRKIKLILYDDQSDKALVKSLYEKLLVQDQVDLVFSPYSTPLTLGASEITETHKKLMLAIAAAAEKPWERGFRYLFQLYAPAKRQFIGLLDMMAQNKLNTLSLLYDETSEFNLDMIRGVEQWAAIFKINILYKQGFNDGKSQLPGLVAQARTHDAHGLVLSAYPPDSYELIRILKETRYSPTVLGMPITPAHPDFYKRVGEMADCVFGPSQWEPSERIPFPGTKRFIDEFTAFSGHLPSFHAASAYSACQLMEKAVIQAQSLDNDKMRDYIAALDTVTVLGRFKVDPSGKQVGHNSFLIQWQEGKKEIVWPGKMKTAPAKFKAPQTKTE